MSSVISLPQANLKMALWQAESSSMSSNELYVWLDDLGLPSEVVLRLHELATFTKKVGNKIVDIGKIVLMKIIEFIKAHPNLSTGIALGASVSLMVSAIPFLGPILAPLAAAMGITIGAIAGHRLDKEGQGHSSESGVIGITQDVIEVARLFFELLIDVFNTVFQRVINA